jgi:hypothetical protein
MNQEFRAGKPNSEPPLAVKASLFLSMINQDSSVSQINIFNTNVSSIELLNGIKVTQQKYSTFPFPYQKKLP